ncbi:MAG: hypothetical protein H6814_11665 [Phycisphaeraceae bacterium]|nr:hypothetical protein [Phycisphaeraceae bacterium]
MHSATPENNPRERSYLNTVLTVIALLLAVIAFDLVVGSPGPVAAMAAEPGATTGAGHVNPAAQRQEMLVELRKINSRLGDINSMLGRAIEVEVVRMPSGGSGD